MISGDMGLHWWCQTRANLIDDELAALMVKAGCEGISFGVESGDEDVLRDSDKAVTLDDIRHGVRVCHNAGLPVYGGFIIGHPSDTVCSVVNSMLFSVSSGLDYAGFGLMMPFPGTRVREQALLDGGIVCDDWARYYAGEVLYVPPGLRGVDVRCLPWRAHGRFLWSSGHRLFLGLQGYCRMSGWRSKADFVRRLCYGLVFR